MRLKFPPVDDEKLRDFVRQNQGVTRRICFKNFAAEGAKKSTQQTRYKVAMDRGISDGWLFVQEDSGIKRLYTTSYAFANRIKGKVGSPRKAYSPSNKDLPEIVELHKRTNLINRLWPASDRAYINNCTF